jgi:hypothetical protein
MPGHNRTYTRRRSTNHEGGIWPLYAPLRVSEAEFYEGVRRTASP